MWLFGRKKHDQESQRKTAMADAIHRDTLKKLNKVANTQKRLNDELEKDGGVTYRIFLATGGEKRRYDN